MKYAIVALSVLSIGLHALGALNGGSWNRNPDIDQHPERLWSWMDSPPVYYGKTVVIDMRQALSRLKRLAFSMPSSRRAPQKLSAAYRLISSLDPEPTVYPYEFLNIHVHAHNTGEAIWLARAKDNKGAVRLGWRWLRGGQSFFSIEGREGLKYDIFPGEHYEFTTKIPSPREPGQYTLEIGLVSEGVTWFSDQGIQPLQVAVHVLSPPTQNFESLVAKDLKTVEDPPHIAIASNLLYYRGGDVCQVTVNVVNQNRPRIVDTYLALAWPNGRLEFWDGNKFLSYTAGPWIPLARRVELVQGFRIANQPLLQWKLIDMPSGPYTLYLILSESNAFRVIATAQASFELEP
ncbi:MAG TPA: hypothetical protein VF944_00900 [Candidatus Bathyarchaeia archaeon]